MRVKQIGPEEYKEICKWWTAHSWPAIPQTCLPSTGYMVSDSEHSSEVGVYAVWLMLPKEGSMAWLDWWTVNPDAPKEGKTRLLQELVEHASTEARNAGCSVLFTALEKDKVSFIKKLETTGFANGNETVTHLIKILN